MRMSRLSTSNTKHDVDVENIMLHLWEDKVIGGYESKEGVTRFYFNDSTDRYRYQITYQLYNKYVTTTIRAMRSGSHRVVAEATIMLADLDGFIRELSLGVT